MQENEQRKIFNEWLKAHKALIFKVIRAYAFHEADQNDLFQDVCLQIWRSVPKFRSESAVSTWLYRIALNTAIKWSTKEKKHVAGHHELTQVSHLISAEQPTNDDRVTWLYAQIHRLDEVDRSLALLLLEGYSYREMSKIVGISESNVGVKIHRIKDRLIKSGRKITKHGV